jgi:CHASE2 domain-containing sensor protein
VPKPNIAATLLAKRRAIVFTTAAALGSLALLSGIGDSLDHGLGSVRDVLRSKAASGEVHVIEIDPRSLKEIHKWPLPREVHAKAVETLHRAGARVIAFDVDFSSPSDPAQDARFAAALKGAGGSVVLPTFRQHAGSGSSDFSEKRAHQDSGG